MNLVDCILISSVCNNLQYSQSSLWVNYDLQKVIKDLNPHHITLFTNTSLFTISKEEEYFFYKITQGIPNIKVDLTTLAPSSRIFQVFQIPRHTTVHLYVHNGCFYDDGEQFFYLYQKYSTHLQRPKLLVLDFINQPCADESYRFIFEYAWSKKFLDFSLIKLQPKHNTFLLHFNPFYNVLSSEILNVNLLLFPDKVRDANGYELKLPYFHMPPIIDVTEENGTVTINNGLLIPMMKIILKSLNFSIKYVKLKTSNETTSGFLNECLILYEKGEINMMLTPQLRRYSKDNDSLLYLNLEQNNLEIVSIGPIGLAGTIRVPLMILVYVIIVPAIFLFLDLVSLKMQLSREKINILNIIRLLFGAPPVPEPRFVFNKIIYTFVAIMSMVYSSDFISTCTDLEVNKGELTFNTFKEIDISNLTVIAGMKLDRVIIEGRDKHMTNVISKSILNDTICYDSLLNNKPVICLFSKLKTRHIFESHSNISRRYKISEMAVAYVKLQYSFEEASPYFEKFKKTIQRLDESGISTWLNNIKDYTDYRDDKTTEVKFGYSLLSHVYEVLLIGYSISFVSFVLEIFIGKMSVRSFQKIFIYFE